MSSRVFPKTTTSVGIGAMLLKMTFLNFEHMYSFILRWNCCKVSTRYLLSSLTLKKWRYAKLKGYSGKEFSVMKIISLLKETDTEWNYFYIFSQIGIARIRYIAICKKFYYEIVCCVRIWNRWAKRNEVKDAQWSS